MINIIYLCKLTFTLVLTICVSTGAVAHEVFNCQVLVIVCNGDAQEQKSIENFKLTEIKDKQHILTLAGSTRLALELDGSDSGSEKFSHETQYHDAKWNIIYRKSMGSYTESIHFNFDQKTGVVMYKAITGSEDSVSASGKCIRNIRK